MVPLHDLGEHLARTTRLLHHDHNGEKVPRGGTEEGGGEDHKQAAGTTEGNNDKDENKDEKKKQKQKDTDKKKKKKDKKKKKKKEKDKDKDKRKKKRKEKD